MNLVQITDLKGKRRVGLVAAEAAARWQPTPRNSRSSPCFVHKRQAFKGC